MEFIRNWSWRGEEVVLLSRHANCALNAATVCAYEALR